VIRFPAEALEPLRRHPDDVPRARRVGFSTWEISRNGVVLGTARYDWWLDVWTASEIHDRPDVTTWVPTAREAVGVLLGVEDGP
jgi:hypothetical protein